MPLPFLYMIYLAPNTADQTVYTTAYEGRRLLDESFTHYLILFYQTMGDDVYALIGTVVSDNARYTQFTISTDADDPTSSSILVPSTINGIFHYIIYGQNSDSNLDPLDAVVVGEVERGLLTVTDGEAYYTDASGTVPKIQSLG